MILTQTLRTISRQRKLPALPVLFMLDEMGTVGNLSMVEQSFGLMAGLGIRIWGFLQDLSQLQRDYPKSWETFWSNSSIIQVLNCGDLTTSEHVSKYLGTATVNAKTGSWSLKTVQHDRENEYEEQLRKLAARLVIDYVPGTSFEVAFQWVSQVRDFGGRALLRGHMREVNSAIENADKSLVKAGFGLQGKSVWTADEQLASRPVLYPYEVRDSPSLSSIIIRPGRGNFRLQRFEYFSHPVLSARARPDPNKSKPRADSESSPAPQKPPPPRG